MGKKKGQPTHKMVVFELMVSILEQNLGIMTDSLACSVRKANEKLAVLR